MASGTTTEAFRVSLNASGDITTRTIRADVLTLNGFNIRQLATSDIANDATFIATGDFTLADSARLIVNDGAIAIDAASAGLDGNISVARGEASITTTGNIAVNGDVSAPTVILESGSNIAMSNSGVITGTASVVVDGQSGVSLTRINGGEGSVSLISSNGAITDGNGANTNVVANQLSIDANTGIGGSGSSALNTQVATLAANNTAGEIHIENNGDIDVLALRTNGDIDFTNVTGDLTLVTEDGASFNRSTELARNAGGIVNGGYETGTVTITVDAGNLVVQSPPSVNGERPDVVGTYVDIGVSGSFTGSGGRPMVVYARDQMRINASSGIFPIWAFNDPPEDGLVTDSDLIDSTATGSVSELLIDVESVDEVDPAVFTEVRNYAYDNISILMPRDQRYDDDMQMDEEEEEDENEEILL